MRRWTALFCITLALGLLTGPGHAREDAKLSYGVHVHGVDGPVSARFVETRNYLNRDFTVHMFDFPVVSHGRDEITFTVHHPDFRMGALKVEARPIASAAAQHPVDVQVTPVGEDKYKVESRTPLSDDRILLVDLGCCVNGVYGVSLGQPRAAILKAFGRGTDRNPVTAESTLDDVTDALPDDVQLRELQAYWATRVAQEKATEHFEFVKEVWSQYEAAETTDKRIGKLKHVRSVAERYLEEHPEGREREEVKAMLEKVRSKLDV